MNTNINIIEKIYDFIGKWIIIAAGAIASIGAFTDVFKIRVSMLLVVMTVIFVTGIFLAISKIKYKKIVNLIFIALMIILIVMLRKALINGIYLTANHVIELYNVYFGGTQIAYFDVKNQGKIFSMEEQYTTLLICMAAMIYCYILVTATWYKLFASIHILLSMIFVVPGMLLGGVPNSFYMTVLILYYLACFMYQHNRIIYPFRLAVLAVIGASIVGFIFLIHNPRNYNAEERYQKYYERLNKTVEKFKLEELSMQGIKNLFTDKETASGGINGGKLGEVSGIKYTGDVMLKLKLQPDSNNVYLKGFVANEYQGNSWEPMSKAHGRIYDKFMEGTLDVGILANEYLFDEDGLGEERRRKIEISHEKDKRKYSYFPYFFDIGTMLYYGITTNYDLSLKLSQKTPYEFSYASMAYEDFYEYYSRNERNSAAENMYYETSFSIPENVKELFDEILENPVYYDSTATGLDECVKYVKSFLEKNTRYSLSPGKLKKGDDYVVDFLTEKKKGYCTAYASAAVLMFRYLGVPARYVEGYVVAAKDIEKGVKNEDGSISVQVKDRAAHAWAEVYVPGLGFVPIEVTPGYSSGFYQQGGKETTTQGTNETPTTKRKSEKETTSGSNKATTENPESKISTKENRKEESSNKNAYSIYGIIALILFACILSVIAYQILNKKKHMLDYKTGDLRHNIIVLSVLFGKSLDKLKIKHSKDINQTKLGENINRLIKGAEKVSLKEEDTAEVLKIIAKANYCDENTQFSSEEYDKVRHYVEEFKNSLQYLKNKV